MRLDSGDLQEHITGFLFGYLQDRVSNIKAETEVEVK